MHVCACTRPRARVPTRTHARAHMHTQTSNIYCFSTATMIREHVSILRYAYIACLVSFRSVWFPQIVKHVSKLYLERCFTTWCFGMEDFSFTLSNIVNYFTCTSLMLNKLDKHLKICEELKRLLCVCLSVAMLCLLSRLARV